MQLTKFSALTPGIYATTKDIQNPNADRRVKRNWSKWSVIPANTRFIVTRYTEWADLYPNILFWKIAHIDEPHHDLIVNESVNVISQHALAHAMIENSFLLDEDARSDEDKDDDIRDAAHDLLSALEGIMAGVEEVTPEYEAARLAIRKARGLNKAP